MDRHRIIIVDDESEILMLLKKFLESEDFEVHCTQDGYDALALIDKMTVDIVITDIRMPGMDGMELLRRIKRKDELIEVIVLTGFASLEAAVSSMKSDGAFDFLTKPIENFDDLLISIEKALSHRHLRTENVKLLEELHRNQHRLETQNETLRRAQQRLDYLRRRYEDLYEHAPVGYVTVDAEGRIQEVNHTAATLLGRVKETIQGVAFSDFIAPEGLHEYRNCRAALTQTPHHRCELPILRADETVLHASIDVMAILGPDSQPEQMRVALSDRTEQKKMEDALKQSEQRYRSFVENVKGIAFQLHLDGRPIFYHGAVSELTGYDEIRLLDGSNGWEALIDPDDTVRVAAERKRLADCGDRSLTQEYRIRHADGQWRWVREHIQNICDDNGRPTALQGLVFDITEHKALQAQSFQSRKVEAIATLAGGVAHQFNNALTGLVGNMELLGLHLDSDPKSKDYLQKMEKLSDRMKTLTQQLLAYARGGKYNPCNVKLGQLVDGSLELVRHRLKSNVKLELHLDATQDLVHVDTAQLQMVLLALLDNAVEALEKGGRIRIRTTQVEFSDADSDEFPNRQTGPFVCLTVEDNGCGMGKETEAKIFDPFFSTKFVGRGLGLSAAYGIVANHSGWISASSTNNVGTELKVYLPLVAETVSPPAEKNPPKPTPVSHATLMVVEDEPMVMDAVGKLLEQMEYRVITAADGREALKLLRAHRETIDLVLLDVRLPDLEADVVFGGIRAIRPGMPVVLCSGFHSNGPVEELLEAGANGFLKKPFSAAQLSDTVQTLLRQQGATRSRQASPEQGATHLPVV
jgi:PAS domain S-box-containing protein